MEFVQQCSREVSTLLIVVACHILCSPQMSEYLVVWVVRVVNQRVNLHFLLLGTHSKQPLFGKNNAQMVFPLPALQRKQKAEPWWAQPLWLLVVEGLVFVAYSAEVLVVFGDNDLAVDFLEFRHVGDDADEAIAFGEFVERLECLFQ